MRTDPLGPRKGRNVVLLCCISLTVMFAVGPVAPATSTPTAPRAGAVVGATVTGYPDVAAQPVGFGDAGFFGSMGGHALVQPVVGLAGTPDGRGYWLVAADGGVFAFGDAGFFGSMGGHALVQPVVGLAGTPDGRGYWLVAADGGVFAFGDAGFFGSMGGHALVQPVVGLAGTPDGRGYWLVAADGGVFAFGDAGFFGSMGGHALVQPVVGLAGTPDGRGYWLVAADGGVFAFGDAGFFGSMGGHALVQPVVGLAGTPDGRGYWLGAADGGVFAFGDAGFFGSMGGQQLTNPIAAIAASPDGAGYWLIPSTVRPFDWAVAGTVISNLDTAPDSPYTAGEKVMALTFDDGPSPTYTPQVLQILVADHVPASFEIVGENGAAYPQILRQEVTDGMVLVNHTWTHVDLTTLAASGWPGQVDQTDALLQGVTGHPARCLRPPYGFTDAAVVTQLGQRGLAELSWDVDPSDYLLPGAAVIAQRVLGALHPGAIVILHDGGGDRSQTVGALPSIISGILAAGYRIVPVCGG